jgi:hypothetical protein
MSTILNTLSTVLTQTEMEYLKLYMGLPKNETKLLKLKAFFLSTKVFSKVKIIDDPMRIANSLYNS